MMTRQGHGRSIAVLALLAAGGVARSCPAGEIRLWPTATVQGDAVRLGDVADLRGFEEEEQIRLAAVVLRSPLQPGGEILLSAADVREAVSAESANLAAIRIYGASRCRVSRTRPPREAVQRSNRLAASPRPAPAAVAAGSSKPAASRTIETLVREYLTARSADPKARVEIRFSPAGRRVLDMPAEGLAVQIRPTNDRRWGMISLEVEIATAEGPPCVEAVLAEVLMVREVVVARRPINKGKCIEARDLQMEERRFSDSADIGLTDLAAAVGRQSTAFVRQGEMLRAEGLVSRPVVNRGDTVTIWARLGGVEVKTTGKAQQAGALGDVIRVRRDGAKRHQDLLDAVVTGPKTVAVTDVRQTVAGNAREVW